MQTIRDALLGCLEIPLFLKDGARRFANSKTAALWSFTVPVILLPLSVFPSRFNPEVASESFSALFVRFLLIAGIGLCLYLPLMLVAAKQLKVEQEFFRFVNAQNWLSISQIVIYALPLSGVMATRWQWDEVYPFLVFVMMYGYAYMAFAIAQIYRTNWMIGAALSILGMACDDAARTLVKLVLPLPLE